MSLVMMLFLLGSTIFDLREKKIPGVWIWGSIIVMAGYRGYMYLQGQCDLADVVFALIPGMVIICFSKISNGIGEGDGLQIISTGCYFTGREHMGMLMIAFTLASIMAAGIFIFCRSDKNRRIAFVPYIFMAAGITMYLR